MAIQMVMAIGDSGQAELTPANDVVEIPVLQFATHPVTGGNVGIPATIRALHHVFGKPVRLTGVSTSGQPWPRLRWRDDRGKAGSCYVRNAHDARDPLFDQLPPHSRARIARAVAAMEA
ncbi:hypothetical protein [Luteimonas sp. R10]|uniref:hypothetical protein n=1 Tax=Luteimonas sp. R10 TaxID=3108176 RepID=UPI003085F458|nr:hypothetical protein U3649_14495 [Luteimonas sp. R10]